MSWNSLSDDAPEYRAADHVPTGHQRSGRSGSHAHPRGGHGCARRPDEAASSARKVGRAHRGTDCRCSSADCMNILFLADNFPPEKNAQASRVYERACYWVEWGHRVTVITCAPNFPEGKVYAGYKNRWHQTETMSGIRVVRVKAFIPASAGMVL